MQQRRRALWLGIPALILLIITYFLYLSGQNGPALLPTNSDPTQEPNSLEPEDVLEENTTYHPAGTQVVRNATRTLVIAKLQEEDTVWVDRLPQDDPYLTSAVYVVDSNNTSAPFTVPLNKGHEVMVYLTYIIDHYHSLSDISIFMHAHQITWHNNDFLDFDSAKMVRRLRSQYILDNGYMNLRCHLEPGCPDHIHPYIGKDSDDILNVPEAAVIGMAWGQLFPGSPVPSVLSQPCCGQFAVSADQIRKIPPERYLEFREWLLATELDDRLSGRVWEYIWHWLFTGQAEFCPVETTCYCEGYGICFDPNEYRLYFQIRGEARKLEGEVRELESEATEADITTSERITELNSKVGELHGKMDEIKARTKGIGQ
ncbi:hypothetical protein AFCA_002186 [Aspergillus flavus]|uniref:DNA, SC005 n=2 Tax=Aspergillus subgen. Circumdati TaxID=2720871 RepID=Q2UTD8_ASPOR|nr:unnamed protein product [Aspergillus oryzae RIB40]RAQ68004.1 hypothetical protein COH20_011733 [Aspergillus flavus]GMF77338.1 unnamed protein product [Aspergillus oryzae]RMZ37695.1 hypothetical protein CA14_005024 [Aspergillus flavus]UCK59369.1 hypothetical protein AFCA_002186 [Aspergillus flavus]BAE55177.1 unnamed protein product [Aspergillus oryzae RIB40]